MGACHHLFEQIEIEGIIGIVEKRLLPPIATLGHAVWQAGNDDAGAARHAGILAGELLDCNFSDEWVPVTIYFRSGPRSAH